MQLLHPGCSTPQKSLLPLFGHRSSGMIRGSIRSRQEDIFSPKDNSLPQSFIFSPPLPPSLLASRLIPLLPTNEAELEVQVSHCGIKQEVENVAIPDARKTRLLLKAASTSWVAV